MTQYLNLDELAPVRRQVMLNGVKYAVKDMTVEHFVEINQLAEELEEKKDMTPVESVDATVRTVALSLEGCTDEAVRKLSLEQLAVLSRFIRGEFTPDAIKKEAAAAGDAGGNVAAQSAQG